MPSTANYVPERADSLRAKRGKADGVRFRDSGYVAAAARPKTAQAVLKVISQARGHRAKILMNYVARTDTEHPLALETESGVELAGAGDIEAVYNEWKQDFERARRGERAPRHVTHLIFSGDCKQTPENARAVQSAIAELMQEQFGQDGYRYLMVLHTDTDHPHVHVLLNNYHRDKDGPKVRINPPELLAMRQQFAQKLRERGIEQQATLRKDRLTVLEAVAKGAEDLQAGGAWFERKLFRAAEANPLAPGTAEATPEMLKWANDLAAKNGVALAGSDFVTVRQYLDAHSPHRMGLDAAGRAPAEKPSAFNAFAKRRQMVKAIAKLKADVKAHTLPFSQERRERMAVLRRLDHELINPAAPNYKRLVEDLVLKIQKDRERVRDHIRALTDPASLVTDNKRRRQREDSINRILARNLDAVRSARIDLMRAPGVSVVEGYRLGHQLKAYERELLKIQRQFAFGAERAAAPGTAAEVAQERATAATLARAERIADKLEKLGAWYEPTARHGRKRTFDPVAKRQALTKIATHLGDTLSAAQASPDSAIAQRVTTLRRTLIDAPAPQPRRVIGAIDTALQDVRLRIDFDARRAAYPGTTPAERDTLRQASRARLEATANRLRDARRELGELPGLTERERTEQAARFKRMQRVFAEACRHVDSPAKLSATLAGLDRLCGPSQTLNQPSLRRHINGPDLYAGPAGYGLRDSPAIPFRQPELYAIPHREGAPAATLDSLRTLSGRDMDGAAQRSAVLLPDHARDRLEDQRAARAGELRRPDPGLGAGSGSARESDSGERIEPRAAPGDRLTSEQLADLLQLVHARLIDAKEWDDSTPFRSGQREFYEGSKPAPTVELDAFAKRRAMLKEIDALKPEIDAAHVNFTPEMRRTLAAIRGMRESLDRPAGDVDRLVNQLAQKITNDQLAIERRSDQPAASAVEALQRRRAADRTMTRNLQSIEDARRELQRSPNLKPMERISVAARLKSMSQAVEAYSGKGLSK